MMAAVVPGEMKLPFIWSTSCAAHAADASECTVMATAFSDGADQPPADPECTTKAVGVPAGRSLTMHEVWEPWHGVGFHDLPPSYEYCTVYAMASASS